MPRLIIDNRQVEVAQGSTILDAAQKCGIEIPTMCFLPGCEATTSCMVCMVKIEGKANFVPACATAAVDGMVIHSDVEDVHQARAAALELLLSDHLGDCMGPCNVTCPARMNIPLMIRRIAAGKLRDAIVTVKKDIPLPAVLGRICPAPCEKACRREDYDKAVSICLLKRYVADVDLASARPYVPACKPAKGRKVAIAGAGPAGLSAAYYLAQDGFACTIYDDHEKAGGMLRYGVSRDELPESVLDAEIAIIQKLGVKFQGGIRVGQKVTVEELQKSFDAVFLATGVSSIVQNPSSLGKGVFSAQISAKQRKLAVRAVADGKEAAMGISRYLSGDAAKPPQKPFNIRIGKVTEDEMKIFLADASDKPRVEPSQPKQGMSDKQAVEESARCLHCDCRKSESCKLRKYAGSYDVQLGQYKSQRRPFTRINEHPQIIYEPGKCIKCGLCIQITARECEKLGLTFTGRGFDMQLAIPFGKSFPEALTKAAVECAGACPTAAISLKD
jgi:ferredoxin